MAEKAAENPPALAVVRAFEPTGPSFDFICADNLTFSFRLEFFYGTLRRKLEITRFRMNMSF